MSERKASERVIVRAERRWRRVSEKWKTGGMGV